MLHRVFDGASFHLVTVIGLLLALSIPATVNADEEFCPEEASVNLTNAKQNASGYLAESGHFFPIEIVRNEEGALRSCMCDIKPCVSICPTLEDDFGEIASADDFSINSTEISIFRTTSSTSEDAGNLSLEAEEWFHFVAWDVCMDSYYYELFLYGYEGGEWHLFENGSLFGRKRNDTKILLDWRKYCLWNELNYTSYIPLTCFTPISDSFNIVLSIGGLISVPLLVATIFVYSVLPQLKNIHGKTLCRYLGCLLVMNVCRVIEWIYPSFTDIPFVCPIFEFIMYFSLLTSFLWLNVICFDIWWRFGGYGSIRDRGRIEDRGKLIGYSIYAWGTVVVMSVICFGVGHLPSVPMSEITPVFRMESCWSKIESDIFLLLSFAPVFLSIICNTCLFVLTSIKLIQYQRNSRRQLSSGDSKRHDDNQLQLSSVNLKLFVIMGISWPTVFIWMFWDPPIYVRYVTILLNELQGIPIFVVLVCKKKIWQSLKMRFKW